ncbi:binding protein IscA [Seminavis robusta]|uniref:Binding protein IscA n=1 Tax=Seminavis robusta TaxID=568900 RepID=A0A9N8EPI5_9STRA|nr:binding protein IscA [Seminavis robusta]|eukprot:Sro1453_g273990.1 binding protein IscA (171) ;mRNA; r:8161-8810
MLATSKVFLIAALLAYTACVVSSFQVAKPQLAQRRQSVLFSSTEVKEDLPVDYDIPDDSVVTIKPNAMNRLRELRDKQEVKSLVLRMGVRSGGCSGMSYIMDFSTEDAIQEDDEVDEYEAENIKCVVDSKSMLYLYGLELDYSDELIGGGFKFFNPNAEESCGCGSSFGV